MSSLSATIKIAPHARRCGATRYVWQIENNKNYRDTVPVGKVLLTLFIKS